MCINHVCLWVRFLEASSRTEHLQTGSMVLVSPSVVSCSPLIPHSLAPVRGIKLWAFAIHQACSSLLRVSLIIFQSFRVLFQFGVNGLFVFFVHFAIRPLVCVPWFVGALWSLVGSALL